jgi:hypothetical protein
MRIRGGGNLVLTVSGNPMEWHGVQHTKPTVLYIILYTFRHLIQTIKPDELKSLGKRHRPMSFPDVIP